MTQCDSKKAREFDYCASTALCSALWALESEVDPMQNLVIMPYTNASKCQCDLNNNSKCIHTHKLTV